MRGTRELSRLGIIILSVLGAIFIASIIIIACTQKNAAPFVAEQQLVGEETKTGVQAPSNENESPYEPSTFDGTLLAPFVDMASWVDTSSRYSINGAPDLGQIYDEIGLEYLFLGFVRPDDNQPLTSDGTIRWGWGGFYDLSERGNDGFQYEGIKQSIQNLRDRGGDVVVSVGGQLGKAPWTVTQNVTKLKEMYIDIIEAYDLTRIDLDIEEINQGYEQNVANAKAIKRAQDQTGVEVVLTIPIMPYGYTSTQKNVLRAYIGNGVNIKYINNMTMCYGNEVNPGEDFADASIRAIDNAANQVKAIYAEYGVDLGDDAYKMLGATVDIGYENQYNPVFTPDMTRRVAEYANEKDLGMFSYWSLNRDSMMQYNSAIDTQYEFYDASLCIWKEENKKILKNFRKTHQFRCKAQNNLV